MRSKILIQAFAALTVLLSFSSQGTLITTFDGTNRSGTRQNLDSVVWQARWNAPSDYLFNITLTDADDSRLYSFSSGLGFDQTVAAFANGINDIFSVTVNRGGYGSYESNLFAGFDPSIVYDVYRVDILFKEVTLDSPGSDPTGQGVWTDILIDFEISVFGTERSASAAVSEPASLALLVAFLPLMITRKRRQKAVP